MNEATWCNDNKDSRDYPQLKLRVIPRVLIIITPSCIGLQHFCKQDGLVHPIYKNIGVQYKISLPYLYYQLFISHSNQSIDNFTRSSQMASWHGVDRKYIHQKKRYLSYMPVSSLIYKSLLNSFSRASVWSRECALRFDYLPIHRYFPLNVLRLIKP